VSGNFNKAGLQGYNQDMSSNDWTEKMCGNQTSYMGAGKGVASFELVAPRNSA